MILLVAREHLTAAWREVEGYLEKALTHSGQFDKLDILQLLINGDMQLWIDSDFLGAGVTQVIPYPRQKVVRVVLLGGVDGLGNWVEDMLGQIENWAREIGATRLEEVGRKGWAKVGHRCGWKESAVVMSKELK